MFDSAHLGQPPQPASRLGHDADGANEAASTRNDHASPNRRTGRRIAASGQRGGGAELKPPASSGGAGESGASSTDGVDATFHVLQDCLEVDGGLRELGERVAAVLAAPFDAMAVAALDRYLTGEGRRAAVAAWERLNKDISPTPQPAQHSASRTPLELVAQLREVPADAPTAPAGAPGGRGRRGPSLSFGQPRRPRWGMGGVAC